MTTATKNKKEVRHVADVTESSPVEKAGGVQQTPRRPVVSIDIVTQLSQTFKPSVLIVRATETDISFYMCVSCGKRLWSVSRHMALSEFLSMQDDQLRLRYVMGLMDGTPLPDGSLYVRQ